MHLYRGCGAVSRSLVSCLRVCVCVVLLRGERLAPISVVICTCWNNRGDTVGAVGCLYACRSFHGACLDIAAQEHLAALPDDSFAAAFTSYRASKSWQCYDCCSNRHRCFHCGGSGVGGVDVVGWLVRVQVLWAAPLSCRVSITLCDPAPLFVDAQRMCGKFYHPSCVLKLDRVRVLDAEGACTRACVRLE